MGFIWIAQKVSGCALQMVYIVLRPPRSFPKVGMDRNNVLCSEEVGKAKVVTRVHNGGLGSGALALLSFG